MITIGFFSNDNLVNRIVQWFQGSNINHCAIGFEQNGQQYWFEAGTRGGVQVVNRGYLSGMCAEFQVLPDISKELQVAMQARLGQPYDYLTIFGFILMIIFHLLSINIDNPFYDKSSEVCSELIIEVDTQHLIPEFQGLIPANISPATLFNICSTGSSFKRLC
jgi:hypothetical protein